MWRSVKKGRERAHIPRPIGHIPINGADFDFCAPYLIFRRNGPLRRIRYKGVLGHIAINGTRCGMEIFGRSAGGKGREMRDILQVFRRSERPDRPYPTDDEMAQNTMKSSAKPALRVQPARTSAIFTASPGESWGHFVATSVPFMGM